MQRSHLHIIRGGATHRSAGSVRGVRDRHQASDVTFRRNLLGYYALSIIDGIDHLGSSVPEEPSLEWSDTVRLLQQAIMSFDDEYLLSVVELLDRYSSEADAVASYHVVTVDYARRALRGFNGGLHGVLAESPDEIVEMWKEVSAAIRHLSGWFRPRLVS